MEENNRVSSEELIAFMTEVTSQDNCPGCAHEDFVVCGAEDTGAWRFEVEAVNCDYMIPTYMVYCANCGYARSHNAIIVDRWVMNRRHEQALRTDPLGGEDE
ncbi:hypothetical protein [uncultured Pseudomonas sp.]|uniref:hypothetical protein n=1 Tax=uncultured Pseudomonas sp. TaxID=114707 RepID=UPI00258298C5|nr:hypothetical protein [uncultured Pseudomonas sp.]